MWLPSMNVFLSHNSADKPLARIIGAQLKLAGADVWFDEWKIMAGDSIPGKLDEGLGGFDVFLLIWSSHAARANWVRQELETAIMRRSADSSIRIIPVKLDDSPLPPLLRPYRHLSVGPPLCQGSCRLVDS
jgi:TIR domain